MYCNFFGFTEKPFDVTPDPQFLYLSPGHREVLASLIYGITERRGFITIVGEVGTGKTTLLRTLLGRLDEKTRVAHILNTDLDFDKMLKMALVDIGLARPEETTPKELLLHRLNRFAIKQLSIGNNVVLIADEAQNLDHKSMENLRLLSNLETSKHKLIQIVLAGQPELDVKLKDPQLRQLTQRISLKRYITPLSEDETYEYVHHRLTIGGHKGRCVFSTKAQELIWEFSEGVPRKINIVCDNALLIGYSLRKKNIDARIVVEAIKDLSWSPFSKTAESPAEPSTPSKAAEPSPANTSRPRLAVLAGGLAVFALLVGTGFFLGNALRKTEQRKFVQRHNPSYLKTKGQPDSDGRSFTSVLPETYYRAKIGEEDTSTNVVDEPVESAMLEEETKKEKSVVIPGAETEKRVDVLESRPDRADRSRPRVLQETDSQADILKENSSTNLIEDRVKSDKLEKKAKKEESVGIVEAVPEKRGDALLRHTQFVVVNRGDFLYKIIEQTYGYYRDQLLDALLNENPNITNPDYIMPGQVIKLPPAYK